MSACQQAKRRRRQMRSGYAHMGNSLRRPTCIKKANAGDIGAAIQAERARAAREAKARTKKK
jgi:hypothetical protein